MNTKRRGFFKILGGVAAYVTGAHKLKALPNYEETFRKNCLSEQLRGPIPLSGKINYVITGEWDHSGQISNWKAPKRIISG